MAENLETNETPIDEMQSILDRQRKAFLEEGVVSDQVRHDRLERAVNDQLFK